MRKRGFTLLELLVVIGMLAILMGALVTSVSKARTRAKIAKATQDTKEMTNAILAFENIAQNRSLEKYATGWTKASESSLQIILGGAPTESGEPSPVLYNAQIRNGQILDPWGHPYEFTIRRVSEQGRQSTGQQFMTAPVLPNFFRLTDEERL